MVSFSDDHNNFLTRLFESLFKSQKILFSMKNELNLKLQRCHYLGLNKVESINKWISLVKDRFKINEKSVNQFQNGLRVIGRLWIKQGRKTNLFKTKKIQEALRDMFNTKIKTFKEKNRMIH